jgi:hypothetical protein
VACQPAIQISLLLFVTRDAKPHFELGVLEPIHGLHLSMALLAHDLLLDVPFMVEKDVLRKIIDLHPRRRHLAVEVAMLLFDLRMIGYNVLVTVKAFFHSGYPRISGAAHVRVTELALDLLHTSVDPVAERDRLLRAEVSQGHEVKKVKAGHDDSRTAEDQQDGQLISEQRVQGFPYFTSCC